MCISDWLGIGLGLLLPVRKKNFTLHDAVPKPVLPNLPYPRQKFKKSLMEPTQSRKN